MIEQSLHAFPHAVAGLALGGVLVFLLVAHVVLFLAALVSVLGSPQPGGMKLVWCVFVFVAPFLGPLAWFVIGRSHARRAYQRGSY
ncbi:MAG TPA: PLD nuclease N-terminal domain-containing protein [Pseudonocardiaceae bacterium]|jgi:uncharacterized RDD family membrane protein YckC|nr:PLD nuclease N-terminal domain-containing protein [Pseudonocardiaceae bacterium]